MRKLLFLMLVTGFINPNFASAKTRSITIECDDTKEDCSKYLGKNETNEHKEQSASEVKVGNVSEEKTQTMKRRVESKHLNFMGFGPGFINYGKDKNQSTDSKMGYQLTLGHVWEASPYGGLLAQFTGQYNPNATAYWASGTLGGNLFLSDADVAPFMTADFGLGSAGGRGADNVTGFVAGFGAGVQFFRTSDVHLQLLAKFDHLFANKENKKSPERYGVSLAILY